MTTLTPRQLEIVALLAEGLDNAEIAGRLVIGEGTVRSHMEKIRTKLGLHNRTQIVVYALRKGWVT